MNQELINVLGQVGLNDKEVQIYLALLELGESTVLPISKKSGIKRTYCYDILAGLQAKGLVYFTERNGRRRYSAEIPDKIEELLKSRLSRLSAILPDLKAIYNQAPEKPKVRYYEGKENVILIYEELLRSETKKIDAIASPKDIEAYLGDYFVDYVKKMSATGVISRDLVTKSGINARYLGEIKNPNQTVRVLPDNAVLSTDMIIFDNKLVLISYAQDIHAVVIESSAIVGMQKLLFEMAWNSSSEYIRS